MAGDGFQVVDDLEETLLEFVFLAGDDVVMHADGGHGDKPNRLDGVGANGRVVGGSRGDCSVGRYCSKQRFDSRAIISAALNHRSRWDAPSTSMSLL